MWLHWLRCINQQSHMTGWYYNINTGVQFDLSPTTNILSIWDLFLLLKPNTSSFFLILANLGNKYLPPLVWELLPSLDFALSIVLHSKSLLVDVPLGLFCHYWACYTDPQICQHSCESLRLSQYFLRKLLDEQTVYPRTCDSLVYAHDYFHYSHHTI